MNIPAMRNAKNKNRATDLSVQQLHTFRHVYELSGYAAAARVCDLSVPTVWQQIHGLEKVYGVRLFEKVGRQIRPTEAARRLYHCVDEMLVNLDSTFELIRGDTDASDPITLVTGVRMMMEDLSSPLGDFRRRFPNRLTIRHGNNRQAEQLIISGDADVALTLEASPGQESPLIHYEAAYYVDFLAVAPKRHPFLLAKTSSLREISKHALIVTTPGTHGRDALEQAFHREKLCVNIAVETDNSGFTIACVQAGMGLGILAGRPDGRLCQDLSIRSLRKQLGRRQIVFMWRKGRKLTAPLTGLVNEIRRTYEA